MKKLLIGCCLAAVAVSLTGCKTTIEDHHRADLRTQLVAAKFKPTVEVMKDRGLVKGVATKSYWFWFIGREAPDTFSHELVDGFGGLMIPSLSNAAVYDACKSSGASILLAPRFTVTEESSVFGFSGRKTVTVEGVPARITGAEEIPVEQWPVIFGKQSGTVKTIQQ